MTLWALLGVERTCSDEELKAAYRKACLKYHPDTNGGDPNKTKLFMSMKQVYEKVVERRKAEGIPGKEGSNPTHGFTGTWTGTSPYTVKIDPEWAAKPMDMELYERLMKEFNDLYGLRERPIKPNYDAMAKEADKKKKGGKNG